MAVKASDIITLSTIRDVQAAYRFYKLQSSTAAAPSKPTSLGTPPSGWSSVEPSYTQGSTNSLYTVDLTVFTDNTFSYSEVSLSSSYEAAKAAYNKAVNVETSLAVTAQGIESRVSATYTTKEEFNNLQIGGRNLLLNSNVLYKRTNDAQTVSSKGFSVSAEALKSLIGKTVTESFYLYSPGRRDTSLNENANLNNRFGCHLVFAWRKSNDPSGATKVTYPGLLLAISKGERGRVSATVTVSPPEGYDVLYNAALSLQQYAKPADTNIEWEIGYPKLEIGDKATDWTPAPEDTEKQIVSMQSQITQTAEGLESKVSKTEYNGGTIASLINQTAENVKIQAKNIDLNGAVTANEHFKINEDGSMETKAGNIGSWEISTTGIHKSYKAYVPPDEDSLKQLKEIILDGTLTKNKMYLAWYDYDNDGVLTTTDLLYCKRLVVGAVKIDYYEQTYGFIRPTFDVTVSIRTNKIDTSENDASFSIWTYAYLKEKTYRFGIDGLTAANGKFGGVNTELLAASEVSCDTLTVNGTQETFSLTNSTKVFTFSTADYPAGTVAELIITGSGGVAYALLLFSATMQLAVNSSTWTAAGAIKLTQTNSRQITFSYTGTAAATFTSRIVKK